MKLVTALQYGVGSKLGLSKIEFDKFDCYTPEMLEYCKRDVGVNVKVYKALQKEGVGFSPDSIELEHEVASIMKDQENTGFYFDEYKASMLLALMRENMAKLEDEVGKVFKPKIDERLIYRRETGTGAVAKTGSWDTPSGKGVRLTAEEHEYLSQPANFSTARQSIMDFNISSRKQVGEYLIEFGWKPAEFTVHGRPIVNEKTLSQIEGIPEAELIKDYLMHQKREAQIKSWLKALKDDGRVHGYVIPNGTITGRMTHREPNMAQVPSSNSPYGKECRAVWTVPKGYKLVGIDASGLELRMLAHYMEDKEYTNEIVNGDVHTANLTSTLQDLNLEIRRRHSSMHCCTAQEMKSLEAWLEEAETLVQGLDNLSSIIFHHLQISKIKLQELQQEGTSKV